MRLTQALFDPSVLNLLCYVDDPIAAMRGTDEDRMVYAAIMILVWEAVGFGLSYHKGQMEDSVTWIGATLTADAGGVRAQIKQSIIDDICGDLKRIAVQNVVSKKELHSLIGKLGHCASLLIIMRPFLEPLWAA